MPLRLQELESLVVRGHRPMVYHCLLINLSLDTSIIIRCGCVFYSLYCYNTGMFYLLTITGERSAH